MMYYSNELYHHGVKGMKWGVRKARKTIGRSFLNGGNQASNLMKYGLRRGHAMNVNSRLNKISNSNRMNRMSARQKASFNASKSYWNKRAKGMTNKQAGGRSLIKRTYDSHRSRNASQRAIWYGIQSVSGEYSSNSARKLRGLPTTSAGKAALNASLTTAGNMALDELIAKGFGHY